MESHNTSDGASRSNIKLFIAQKGQPLTAQGETLGNRPQNQFLAPTGRTETQTTCWKNVRHEWYCSNPFCTAPKGQTVAPQGAKPWEIWDRINCFPLDANGTALIVFDLGQLPKLYRNDSGDLSKQL